MKVEVSCEVHLDCTRLLENTVHNGVDLLECSNFKSGRLYSALSIQ
jgi:hypothetical protein